MRARDPVTVNSLLKACYTAFAACALFSFFVNLLMLTMPLFMFQVFDRVLASRSESTLFLLLFMATLALCVQAALDAVRSYAFVRISGWIDRRIAPIVLSTLVKDALDRSKVGSTGPLRSLATLRTFLTGPGMLTLLDLPWTPIFLILIFYLNAPMGVAALGGAILMLILGIANDRLTRPALSEAQQYSSKAYQAADAAVRNAAVVESMGMRQAILRRYHRENERVLSLQGTASDRAATFLAISKSARMLVQMVIMSVAAIQIIDPTTPLTPGMMIAIVLILGRALQPIEMGVGQARNLIEAMDAYKVVEETLRSAGQDIERMSLPAPQGALTVENLYYQPAGLTKPILQRISFDLAAGESIGIVGPSAAGKSTLARLLVGVEKPSLGNVRLDGADVFTWDAEELGRHVGFMPQDVELFAGTVAQNIGRLEDKPDPEQVVKAAQLAGLHEMILRLPQGYDTEIGWAGQILSGGQRQRVALARALYGEPRMVVLDEPNANLDSQGDEALGQAIRALRDAGTTLVLITHRPQTLSMVDKVLVLQNGMVQRYGPRDEMMSFLSNRRQQAVEGPSDQAAALQGPASANPTPKEAGKIDHTAAISQPGASMTVETVSEDVGHAADGPKSAHETGAVEESSQPREPDAPNTPEVDPKPQEAVVVVPPPKEPKAAKQRRSKETKPKAASGGRAKSDSQASPTAETSVTEQTSERPSSPSDVAENGPIVRPPSSVKAEARTLNVNSVRAISAKDRDE